MSKKIETSNVNFTNNAENQGLVDSKPVDFRNVHWFMDDNQRKTSFKAPLSDITWQETTEDGETRLKNVTADGLCYPLRNGWDASQGAVKASVATKADADRAVKDRRRQIDEWKRNNNTQPIAIVAEEVWFPGGKPAEVKYIANEAYRRSRGVLGVITRRAMDANYKGYATKYLIPIVEVTFSSDLERLESHVRENSGKDSGRSQLSEVDIFFIAKKMLSLSPGKAKESDLVRLGFKRGQAVKCFKLAVLDRKFPQLKIAERLLLPAPKGDEGFVYSKECHLPMQRINHQHLQKLSNDYAYNEARSDQPQYKIKGGVQARHVEEYFADSLRSAEAARTQPTFKELMTAFSHSPVALFRHLSSELNNANRDCIGEVEAHAERVNKALAFLELESPPAAETPAENGSKVVAATK